MTKKLNNNIAALTSSLLSITKLSLQANGKMEHETVLLERFRFQEYYVVLSLASTCATVGKGKLVKQEKRFSNRIEEDMLNI